MITKEFQYRRGIYNLLHMVKTYSQDYQFDNILAQLEERVGELPKNNLEESKKFFLELTNILLEQLQEYFEINHEEISTEATHSDSFTLTQKDGILDMVEVYDKYRSMARFKDIFLSSYDSDFARTFRSINTNFQLHGLGRMDSDGSYKLVANRMMLDSDIHLPYDERSRQVGMDQNHYVYSEMHRSITDYTQRIGSMVENFDGLNTAIEEFNLRLQQSLRQEHIKFGISHLKELLSKIVIPVALLEDPEVRKIFEAHDKQVFVKKPTIEDLMPIGSSVHIYSSHDMDDDSSYVAKPIPVSGELPADTEELKYLGVGQYTKYDAESPRSLNGSNPFVINDNVYVKASYEDFMTLVPEELAAEIEASQALLTSVEAPEIDTEMIENETLKTLVDTIKSDPSTDYKKLIEDFIAYTAHFEREENRETGPVFVHGPEFDFVETNISFSRDLLSFCTTHPEGYVVLKDNVGNFAGLRAKERGTQEMYIAKTADEAFRALQMAPGVYTIYDFRNRMENKQRAIVSIHNFRG